MRQLFILRGLPGSGKSTTLEQAGLKDLTISTDALRLQVASPVMLASGKTAISQNIIAIRKMYEAGPALDAAPVLSGKMV
ncbi:hypothetical protein LDL36_18180 [Komagataeibacter sp. FNDCR1]|nr:hypothetical protein [Komagataeibacter sp. FNDCR1]